MFTDSHCHLNFPELMIELDNIQQAMVAAQVTRARQEWLILACGWVGAAVVAYL